MDIMKSKEVKNMHDFMENKLSKDKNLRHIAKEAEWLGDWFHRGDEYLFQEIRERPTQKERQVARSKGINTDTLDIDGVHIDNDDIKDFFEDAQHLGEHIDEFFDPETPLMKEGIKLDAEVRYSPNMQKLIKMVMKDFGIKSGNDLQKAVEAIGKRVVHDIESCPYYRRSKLAAERMMRYAMKSL